MQRVRIGLTGLGLVFLLVLMAAAVLGIARREADINTVVTENMTQAENESVAAGEDAPQDPLAELGVAPGSGGGDATEPANEHAPAPSPKPVPVNGRQ